MSRSKKRPYIQAAADKKIKYGSTELSVEQKKILANIVNIKNITILGISVII